MCFWGKEVEGRGVLGCGDIGVLICGVWGIFSIEGGGRVKRKRVQHWGDGSLTSVCGGEEGERFKLGI